MADGSLTVSELAQAIKGALERAFPGEVWVEGELHGLKRPSNGHVWFDLVEPGDLGGPPRAQLPVVLFDRHRRAVNAMLRRSGGVRMTDGMAIRIRASLDLYPPAGRVQLVMTGIDPDYTLGRLAADRDRVLRRLSEDGLLDRNGSVVVPLVPLHVGLVTAAGSAAYADFVEELALSGFAFRVSHAHAPVQGRGADRFLAAAIGAVAACGPDVVALVRGGGARTDLACFDSEVLARAIATAAVPVFTGIGHETDRSIADEVAHTAHKTPTACAAALVEAVVQYRGSLRSLAASLAAATDRALARERARVHRHAAESASSARRVVEHHQWRLRDRSDRLRDRAPVRLSAHEAPLDAAASELGRRATNALARAEARTVALEIGARALDPTRLLARGWTITRSADGGLARVATLQTGDELVTTFADGRVHSTVQAVAPVPAPDVPEGTP